MKFNFIICCILFCNFMSAQNPGDYDTSFGTNGRVTFAHAQTSITPSDMLIQPDGKILAAVRQSTSVQNTGFVVTRLLSNGSLDATFGINGSTVIDFNVYEDRPYSIALQSDGKILVGGTTVPFSGSTTDIAVTRLNPDGSLDTTFGTGGKTTFFFGLGTDILQKLTVEPNGKIFVVGQNIFGSTYNFGMARLNSDGSLDDSFSNDGKLTFTSGLYAGAKSVKRYSDGRYIIGGTDLNNITIVKLLPDGSLDTSYNSTGSKSVLHNIDYSYLNSIVYTEDDFILHGGIYGSNTRLRKMDMNLENVMSFGTNGVVQIDIDNSSNEQSVANILTHNSGRIFATGTTTTGGTSYFYILAFTAAGVLDPSFSYDGKQLVSFSGYSSGLTAAFLQPDSKIVVGGGLSSSAALSVMGLSRLHIQQQTLSVATSKSTSSIQFYPNPVQDVLNINNIDKDLINSKLKVMDASSRIVFEKNIGDENEIINLSHLSSGVYYLNIGNKINTKIIKK